MRRHTAVRPRRPLIATSAALIALGVSGSLLASGSAAATSASYGFNRPTAIAAGAGHLWIANTGGNSVTELNEQGGLVRTMAAAKYGFHSPDAVTVSGSDVFVLNRTGSVTEVSATTGALVRIVHGARYHFSRPVAMVADAGNIWVVNRTTAAITEFRTSDGSLVRVVNRSGHHPFGLNRPVAITAAGAHLWVVNSTGGSTSIPTAGSVTEIDAATGSFLREVHAARDGLLTPHGIAFDGTHLWVTDNAPGTLTELTSHGGLVRIVSDTTTRNVYLEWDTVVVAHAGQVYVISPPGSSPMVSRLVAASATGKWYECNTNVPDPNFVNPSGLAVHGQRIWVVSPGNNSLAELHVSTGLLIHDFS
jgi:hypothetical protein